MQNSSALDKLITSSNRNGYLEQLKQLTLPTKGAPNEFDIGYRKRVTSYYKKKVLKPFCLLQQPEYRRELRFNSDFNAFVKSVTEFEQIREEPIFKTVSEQMREVHGDTLVFDFGKTCEVSPENIKRRKNKTIDGDYEDNMFTTKISLTQHLIPNSPINNTHTNVNKVRIANQSRIDIVLDSGGRQKSSQTLSPPVSPKRKIKDLKTSTKTTNKYNSVYEIKLNRSRRSNHTLSSSIGKQPQQKLEIKINPIIALQNLNNLTSTDHKLKNFRLSRQKLHELLCKRYGHEIVTTFFSLQTIEDYSGIIKMVTEILRASNKMAQILVFLAMDYNQDGLITEDQLTELSNYITAGSPVNEDINRLLGYAQENPEIKCQPDLPLDFIKQPTIKQYLKINQELKQTQVSSVRGVFRLFSLKMDQEIQKDKDKEKILPNIGRKSGIDVGRKMIRINFEHFQKAFEGIERPNYIDDLVTYLIGWNYDRKQDGSSPRKSSISNMKKLRRGTFSLDPRQKYGSSQLERVNHLEKAHQILGKMMRDNKNFTTVQYD